MGQLQAYRALLRDQPLVRLLGGEFVSSIGDWLYMVAMLVVVWDETRDAVVLGIVGVARIAPYAILSVPAGMLPRATGDDDDTEGQRMLPRATGDDDAEGQRMLPRPLRRRVNRKLIRTAPTPRSADRRVGILMLPGGGLRSGARGPA